MPLPKLVGILNLTPDSFSDGGLWNAPDRAEAQAQRMIEEGAAVIDIGAESTRPNAQPVPVEEEWWRLTPVLERVVPLAHKKGVLVSVDTRRAEVAQRAMDAGADWINDVTGFEDPAIQHVGAETRAVCVVMHSLGAPVDPKQHLPEGCDAVEEVLRWGQARVELLVKHGIAKDKIIFDPGVGFGKTAEQSLALVRGAARFKALGVPVLVGHSRKRFLQLLTNRPREERDEVTAMLTVELAKQGVDYLRVHDVAVNASALEFKF